MIRDSNYGLYVEIYSSIAVLPRVYVVLESTAVVSVGVGGREVVAFLDGNLKKDRNLLWIQFTETVVSF